MSEHVCPHHSIRGAEPGRYETSYFSMTQSWGEMCVSESTALRTSENASLDPLALSLDASIPRHLSLVVLLLIAS
jgi:hypothetical protein